MLNPALPRLFHEHQYVKVSVSPTKTEIGIVVSVDDEQAVVATRHGYNITVKLQQLQRAFLLVLDLNGVLGVRQRRGFDKRPHVDKFIKYALSNFVVSVWTSCEERNGHPIIESLFGDDRDRLLFTLFRNHCTPNPTADKPFGTKKDLQRIFSQWPESFHAVNTIIVDDSSDKCSHPDLALCPTQFSGAIETDEDDTGLLRIMETLDQILREDSLEPLIAAARQRQEELDARLEEEAVQNSDLTTSGASFSATATVTQCDVTARASDTVMRRLQELMSQLPQEGSDAPSAVDTVPVEPRHRQNQQDQRRRHRGRDHQDARPTQQSVVSLLQNARRVPLT